MRLPVIFTCHRFRTGLLSAKAQAASANRSLKALDFMEKQGNLPGRRLLKGICPLSRPAWSDYGNRTWTGMDRAPTVRLGYLPVCIGGCGMNKTTRRRGSTRSERGAGADQDCDCSQYRQDPHQNAAVGQREISA